jgi:peptidyl-prolyl cis-trans isomerase SurA
LRTLLNPIFTLFCAILALSTSVQIHAADIVKLDRIVAVVNQGVVTEQELDARMVSVAKQFAKAGKDLPPDNTLRRQVLERLISDSLQMQHAARTGIKIGGNQVDLAFERIAEQNNLTITEFSEALNKDGISVDKFKADIQNEMTIGRLREREIMSRVTVTETEIDNLLTTQSATPDAQDEYEISHILIRTPEEAAPEDVKAAKEKVSEALSALQSGLSFDKVSATYSDAPNALEGGQLGWKKSGQIPGLFLNALKPLAAGSITEVLRSPNGYHILKLTDKRGNSAPLVIDQTHARHILVKLSEIMSEKEAKHKIDGIKVRLDNNEDFKTLARQYSDDGSSSNGGDLGWINPGDTVPNFEQAMNALAPNEISAPVKSRFGWHIIQVIERRSQDMTKESQRLKARQEIRSRKADEAYQDWLSELRDRAYVDMKLEDEF